MLDNPKLRLAPGAGMHGRGWSNGFTSRHLGSSCKNNTSGASPETLTLTNWVRGPEQAGKKTLVISKSTLMVCVY